MRDELHRKLIHWSTTNYSIVILSKLWTKQLVQKESSVLGKPVLPKKDNKNTITPSHKRKRLLSFSVTRWRHHLLPGTPHLTADIPPCFTGCKAKGCYIAGIVGMCKEHLGVALALKVPVFFIVTKVDICPDHILKETLSKLNAILKKPGVKKRPFMVPPPPRAPTIIQHSLVESGSLDLEGRCESRTHRAFFILF
jgi:hypothetical protein